MNREETVNLWRYVRAACPQQAMDDATPAVWYDLLKDLNAADCLTAAQSVAARQPFVAPAEIRAEVRRIRGERLQGFQYVPVEGDDDHKVYLAALRSQRFAVADGRREAAPQIDGGKPRDVPALLEGKMRRPR